MYSSQFLVKFVWERLQSISKKQGDVVEGRNNFIRLNCEYNTLHQTIYLMYNVVVKGIGIYIDRFDYWLIRHHYAVGNKHVAVTLFICRVFGSEIVPKGLQAGMTA